MLLTFVTLGRAYDNMHRDHTSWNFSYRDSGLAKSFVVLQYPSSIDELHVIESFWNNVFILRPPGEDELLERGDGGGGVVLVGPDVRAVEQPKLHLDRLFPAGHLPGRVKAHHLRKIPTTAAATAGRLSRPRPAEESGEEKLPNSTQQGQETDADPTKYPLSPLVKQEFRILSWGAKRRDGRLEGRREREGRSGIPRVFFSRYVPPENYIYPGIIVGK